MHSKLNTVEALQTIALGDDKGAAAQAFQRLAAVGTEEVFCFFLELLEHTVPFLRNQSAMGLKSIGDPRAIQPLLSAINKPQNRGYNGTLVYALAGFDCRYLCKELLLIVFYQGYEAKCMALQILEEQEFEYSQEDVILIQQHWAIVRQSPDAALQDIGVDYIQELLDEL